MEQDYVQPTHAEWNVTADERKTSLDGIPRALIFTNLPNSIFDKSANNPVRVRKLEYKICAS